MKMLLYLPLLCLLLSISGCDRGLAGEGASLLTGSVPAGLEGLWEVSNVSGGFAGINDDFEAGLIRWDFAPETLQLHIENNETTESLYDGFETGTYGFSILEQGGEAYLIINGQEFGNITIHGRVLILDGNSRSEGSGADLFILTLVR